MFCPGCGIQVTGDTKFCKSCGANLRAVREAMDSLGEKTDSGRTWIEEMFLSGEEQDCRRGRTPEQKRINEMRDGVITTFVGIGIMIFLYFLLHAVANNRSGDDAEVIRRIWLAGVIPFLIGIAMIFNAIVFGGREMKREKRRQTALPQPAGNPAQFEAQTTNELVMAPGSSVTEDPTVHLPASGRERA